jgi:heme/copper-type cytochrome/quinol oxidase subunit 2
VLCALTKYGKRLRTLAPVKKSVLMSFLDPSGVWVQEVFFSVAQSSAVAASRSASPKEDDNSAALIAAIVVPVVFVILLAALYAYRERRAYWERSVPAELVG